MKRQSASVQAAEFYSNRLMVDWKMDTAPSRLRLALKSVLMELHETELMRLFRNPKLQVVISPEARPGYSVWAHFPVDRRRLVVRMNGIRLRKASRVLLLFDLAESSREDSASLKEFLRDYLGHILLYLRSPKARNECKDAMREWRRETSN